jgi:RNA polymerase sigma factor (sigma-70 family)
VRPTSGPEDLLRELAPRVLGIVARRSSSFADAEDAVQDALVEASQAWAVDALPENPLAWLVRVASRRLVDRQRSDQARRRREDRVAASPADDQDLLAGEDDTLILLFMCCHPALTPGAAIPLTLRAVGGLTTREIAAAFLVPEATMAQRISRAKATIAQAGARFALPTEPERDERLRSVLHVLYLMFNEGYASSGGNELARAELTDEAIRITRLLLEAAPGEDEVVGLLALMLLTDARRPARTGPHGELVPLMEQDRTRWSRPLIREGVGLVTGAIRRGDIGEYQAQAAIAAVHDLATSYDDTDWAQINALYSLLERMTGNPMVTLNRAVAVAMVDGPDAGLELLEPLDARLGDHHRLHAVRGQLLERAGRREAALDALKRAVAKTRNRAERDYLTLRIASLSRDE